MTSPKAPQRVCYGNLYVIYKLLIVICKVIPTFMGRSHKARSLDGKHGPPSVPLSL